MIKVFPLSIGSTKLPYGQFYGGLNGWTGFGALRRFATDKLHPLLVPIAAYLIDHPTAGPILVDTGINREQAHNRTSYYHGLMGQVTDADEYLLEPEQELPAQLERYGYRCSDIERVILTHLHGDHVGGLRHVAHAEVVLPQAEWDLRHQHYVGFFPAYYTPSFAMINRWKFVDFTSGAFHSFASSYDLLGDGTIRLVPTPGHTGGHTSVIVQNEEYQIFLAADALYTLRHMAVDQIRSFVPGNRERVTQYVDSIRRIQALRTALPDLVIVPTHDHSDYGKRLIQPFLADGVLSAAELEALHVYENRIFNKHWYLRSEAYPHYISPVATGTFGQVVYGN